MLRYDAESLIDVTGNYSSDLTELDGIKLQNNNGRELERTAHVLLENLEGGRMMFAPSANLADTSVETPTGKPVFLHAFERGGLRRKALITIANAAVEFRIPRLAANSYLSFYVAKAFDLGDEAVARIYFVHEDASKKDLLYERSLDPANDPNDRRWHNERIDLSPYGGRSGRLLFECHPGKRGDEIADWIGWSEPKIVYLGGKSTAS